MNQAAKAPLSEETLQRYRMAFDAYDTNDDGVISLKQVKETLNNMKHKPTHNELKEMLIDVDRDNDNCITWQEFMVMIIKKYHKDFLREPNVQRKIFRIFDANKDGYLTVDEFKLIVNVLTEGKVSHAQASEMFDSNDEEKDGLINFKEFKEMIKKVKK